MKSNRNQNQQASSSKKVKTSKHSQKNAKKPASMSKAAQIIGKLGGRPRKTY